MEELGLHQRLHQQMTAYPNIFELFKGEIPYSPPLYATIYKGVDVGQIWGQRFTIWNVLLYDSDPAFKAVLQELDALVAKHKSAYGEHRLRNGIKNDPFSFLSELVVYDLVRPRMALNGKHLLRRWV